MCDKSQNGLECEYGYQPCCGEYYGEVRMTCYASLWQEQPIVTKCSADGRCPTTPATTNIPPTQPTNPDSCPEEFPEYGVRCVVL